MDEKHPPLALQELLAAIRTSENEIVQLNATRADILDRIESLQRRLETLRSLIALDYGADALPPALQISDFAGGTIAEWAIESAKAAGGLVSVADLAKDFTDSRTYPTPRDAYASIYSTLRRDRRFVKNGPGQFRLIDEEEAT